MSDRKASAAARRDFRHAHYAPEVPPHRGKRTHRRAVCRHSPDALHTYIETTPYECKRLREFRCEFCGKKDYGMRPLR